MRMILKFILFVAGISLGELGFSQCGVTDTVIAILDNEKPMEFQLLVDGFANNDLSNPNQGVCGVTLKFNHTQRSELTIDLISPSGQKVGLVGPYIPNNNVFFGTILWDISFVPCSNLASPDDAQKSDHFYSGDAWFSIPGGYTGVYYPYDYCLEDFNSGPVNGTWTFVVHDHSHFQKGNLFGFTIEFCDGTTTECNLCDSYAGKFDTNVIEYCEDADGIMIDLSHDFNDKEPDSQTYNYEYIVSKDNAIIEHSTAPNLDLKEVGEYKLCGLSYHKLDSANVIDLANSSSYSVFYDSIELIGSPYCADLTDTCITVVVNAVDTIKIDTSICFGDTILFENRKLFKSGEYYFKSNANCDSAYLVALDVIELNASIDAPSTTIDCSNNLLSLKGLGYDPNGNMNFKWNVPLIVDANDTTTVYVGQPGSYSFILTEGECSDTATIVIDAIDDIPIIDFDIQGITCDNDTALAIVTSNTTIDSVRWYNGDFYTGDTIKTVTGGDYLVNVYSSGGCRGFEIINIPVDTVVPVVSITANDITCDIDTSFIVLESESDLKEVYWDELGKYGNSVFVLDSGMYHVRFKGVNGCEGYDSIYVSSYKEDIVFTITSDSITCLNPTSTIDFSSPEDSFVIKWVNPNGDTLYTEDITTEIPGIYKYIIINKFGCETSGQYEVFDNTDAPKIDFADDTLYISCGVPVRLDPAIDKPFIQVSWGGPAGFYSSVLQPVVDLEGTYYINVLGENGCSGRDSVFVSYDNTVPDIEIITDTITCIDSIPFLHVKYTGNYSFKWEDRFKLTYFGSNIKGLKNVGGFYYLTVTDNDNGCESSFYTYVPADTVKPEFGFVYTNLLDCISDSLVLTYQTNSDVDRFHWVGDAIDSYKDSIIIWNEGVVHGRLTSTSGCYYEDSITFERDSGFFLSDDTLYLNCYNDLQLTLGPNYNNPDIKYTWSGNNFSSQEQNPVVDKEGLYKLVMESDDCLDSALYQVLIDTAKSNVNITFPDDKTIACDKRYVTFKVNIEGLFHEYFWLGANNFYSDKIVDTIREVGQYICYVRNQNGCLYTDTIVITKDINFPEVSAFGDTINCNNPSHELSINATIDGNYTDLEWEGPNGFKSNELNNIVSDTGKYVITVTNINGCSDTDTAFVITDFMKPDILFGDIDMITCYNDSVVIEPVIFPDSFNVLWTGPLGFSSTEKSIKVNQKGNYIVRVVGENGCEREDTVNVSLNKLHPMLIIDGEDLNCCSSKKEVKLTATADNYSQKWIFPNDSISTNRNIIVADSGIYIVEVEDLDNGCISVDSIAIKWDSLAPDIQVNNYFLNCDTSKIEMIAYSDMPNVVFKWFGPGYFEEGSKVYTNKAGNYYIIAEGRNCCTSTKSFEVSEKHINPEFDTQGGALSCDKDSVEIKVLGADDDFSVEWSGPNGFSSDLKNPVVYDAGQYNVRVLGKNKCDSIAQVEVSVDTFAPVIELKYLDSLVCDRNEGELSVEILSGDSLQYAYDWSSNNGTILIGKYSDKLLFEGEGTYFLTVKNIKNGCTTVDSVVVTSLDYKLDSVGIEVIPPSCFGFSDAIINIDTVFGGAGPYLFSLDNYWFSNNSRYNSKDAGIYNIYIKDANGCVLDTNIVVPDGGDVQLQLGVDKNDIFLGDSVVITPVIIAENGIKSYHWKPEFLFDSQEDSIQVIKPKKSHNISLTVVDSNGCVAEDVIWIKVKGNPDVYVPNVFTPDGDGINDYFYIKTGTGVKEIKRLIIYNNWGNKLFDKRNLRKNVPIDGWNGKFRGKDAGLGVYVYVFELELEDGSVRRIAGDITIVK